MICGGGLELVNDFMRDLQHRLRAGLHTGAQMGGWFRKEIKSLEDLKGPEIPDCRLCARS